MAKKGSVLKKYIAAVYFIAESVPKKRTEAALADPSWNECAVQRDAKLVESQRQQPEESTTCPSS